MNNLKSKKRKQVYLLLLCCLVQAISWGQNQWNIQLSPSFVDCTGNQVCYQVELSAATTTWALGDQNYRLFFDGDLMTVVSVSSLIPSTIYSPVIIDQNIKITGQGQESSSPLDAIDDNLGFLDFSIIQTDKSAPAQALQLTSQSFTPIAEICVQVDPSVMVGNFDDTCLSLYHSRPSTAGSITNQYTVISENDASNSTSATLGNTYNDLTPEDAEACLSTTCQQKNWNIQLSPSFVDCTGNQVCYQVELSAATTTWALGDQNYRLFFDGDLMTVVSVASLIPSTIYSPVIIDQNIKITGQGQESSSPLDAIDDNLGFLDFSIIQTDKSAPAQALQLTSQSFTPIAEICVQVDPSVVSGSTDNTCLSFYHSRPSTAGDITNQYTVISENDEPESTTSTMGTEYNDLTAADVAACLGATCQQKAWDIRLSMEDLNCETEQVCYQLELKNNNGADWALGDQNYRLFFDGDLMTVTGVTALLPSNIYSTATINQNIKVTNQGQESSSPLDAIDDNLGFLDFTITQIDKSNPNAATQLTTSAFTPIAKICLDLAPQVFTDIDLNSCLSWYHSRPTTAGIFTNQYTVISHNDEPESTTMTKGLDFDDLTKEDGEKSCLVLGCEEFICDLNVSLEDPIYNDNNTPDDLTDDTFTFKVLANGSNSFGWEGGGQTGSYGQAATFGPYPVDEDGVIFTITDVALGTTCGVSVGMNISSCIYTGACTCCQSDD